MSRSRRLLLSPRAAADLEEIAEYIARDNPGRAASFVAELEAKCRAVANSPELYPARADLAPGLRMAVHGRYLVLYRDLPGENTVRSSGFCIVPVTCPGCFSHPDRAGYAASPYKYNNARRVSVRRPAAIDHQARPGHVR